MKGVYLIETRIDEYGLNRRVNGYFATEEEAEQALLKCSNIYEAAGTGRIVFQEFGLDKERKIISETSTQYC